MRGSIRGMYIAGSARTLMIIPTLGKRVAYLDGCVRSVERQDIPLDITIVAPSRTCGRLAARYPQTRVLAFDHRGLSRAINAGLQEQLDKYEFFSWLGDDDLLAPGVVRHLQSLLTVHPEAAVAYGRTRYIDAESRPIYLSRPSRFAPAWLHIGKDYVPQPGSLIAGWALRTVGLLDETLENAMDLDLFLRLRRCGKFIYVPKEVSAYRLHPDAITSRKGKHDESETVRARYRRAWVNMLWPLVRPFVRVADRSVAFAQWHLSRPPVPKREGMTYIETYMRASDEHSATG